MPFQYQIEFFELNHTQIFVMPSGICFSPLSWVSSFMLFCFTYLAQQQKYIWTSGRLCDFKGCDRPDLQPTSINGWFWTAELQKLAPTTDRRQNDWSENGGIGQPQPDNRELQQGGANENCLAILNNFYNDGVHWVRLFREAHFRVNFFFIKTFSFLPP